MSPSSIRRSTRTVSPNGFRSETMRRNSHLVAEMFSKRIYSANVIRVHVGQDNLANRSSFAHKIIDRGCQRLLFFFIGRPGIDHQDLPRVVDQVAVGVSRRRFGGGANRNADVVRTKFDAANRLPMGLGNCQESLDKIRREATGNCFQCVERRWHCQDF